MVSAMMALLQWAMIPIILLNSVGFIVAAIWLGILGSWGLLGYGLLSIMASGMLLGMAMAPGLLFGAPAAMLAERGKMIPAFFFGVLSCLYTVAVITVWCG